MPRRLPLSPHTLPPKELADQVEAALFPPPKRVRRTMADDLPDGLSEPEPPEDQKIPEPPEPTPLIKPRQPDETVPAWTQMTRVGYGDVPHLGWVVGRLNAIFPQVGEAGWHVRLRSYFNNSQFFFQKTERAIALAAVVNDPFAVGYAQSYVQLIFLFHQDRGPQGGHIKDSQGEHESLQLVRAIRDWGRHLRATEIRRLNECCDLPPNVLIQRLGADRREEVWIKL